MNVFFTYVVSFFKKLVSAKKPYSLHRMYPNHHPEIKVNFFVGLLSLSCFVPIFFKISSQPTLLILMGVISVFVGIRGKNDRFIFRTIRSLIAFIIVYSLIFSTLKVSASYTVISLLLPYIVSLLFTRMALNKSYFDVNMLLLVGLIALFLSFTSYPSIWIALWFVLYLFFMILVVANLLNRESIIQNKIKPSLTKSLVRIMGFAIIFSLAFLVVTRFSFESHKHGHNDGNSHFSDVVTNSTFTGTSRSKSTAFRFTLLDKKQKEAPQYWYWKSEILYNYDGKSWTRPPEIVNQQGIYNHINENVSHIVEYQWEKASDDQPLAVMDEPLSNKNLELKPDGSPYIKGINSSDGTYVFQGNPTPFYLKTEDNISDVLFKQALLMKPGLDPLSKKLSDSLYEGTHSEKEFIRKILTFYRENFTYTIQPNFSVSNKLDDIDFFLTKNRKGSCLNFAGSMIVLLRDQNIPARLVVGYNGSHWNKYGGYWQVNQSQAHAWVEVWSPDDHLWVRVDPTGVVANIESRNKSPDDFNYLQDYLSQLTNRLKNTNMFDFADLSKINLPKFESLDASSKYVYWIWPFLILVIVGYLLNTFYKKKHLHLQANKLILKLENKLSKFKLPKHSHEAWTSYFERISDQLDDKSKYDLSLLIADVNSWLYSDQEKDMKQYKLLKDKIKKLKLKRLTS